MQSDAVGFVRIQSNAIYFGKMRSNAICGSLGDSGNFKTNKTVFEWFRTVLDLKWSNAVGCSMMRLDAVRFRQLRYNVVECGC